MSAETEHHQWGLTGMPSIAYYELKIYVPPGDESLTRLYRAARDEHNAQVMPAISGQPMEFDAGFDLFLPSDLSGNGTIESGKTVKLDHKVKCSMRRIDSGTNVRVGVHDGRLVISPPPGTSRPVGYYMYPRSSTGSKTPLRLANSVGIIDSGYRGPLMAVLDNVKNEPYTVASNQRLMQICPPDLSYPLYVVLVDSVEELGMTNRGEAGFGSTGV